AAVPGLAVDFRQTNHEGELIEWVHEAIGVAAAIVINPAAWSFTSLALLDALKMFPGPIVEIHISNIHRREAHYHHSYVSLAAAGVLAGVRAEGYAAAVTAAAALAATPEASRPGLATACRFGEAPASRGHRRGPRRGSRVVPIMNISSPAGGLLSEATAFL